MKKNALLLIAVLLITVSSVFAGVQNAKFRFGNKMRTFIIYTPDNYDPSQKLPLVINMHGFTTTNKFQFDYSEFHLLANQVGCIVVYPQGLDLRWNSGTIADINSKVNDVGFLGRLIDFMSINYNIDETKVYSTGYSAGGFMSFRLACESTNRISAIATVGSSMTNSTFDKCSPSRPIPVMMFNGTSDPVTVFNGFVDVKPNFQVINLWKKLNNCTNAATITNLPNTVTNDNSRVIKETYSCAENTELTLMRIQNGGHTWPGSKPFLFILGNTNQDISANTEMWNFFSNYSIPEEVTCDKPSDLDASATANNYTLSWQGDATTYSLFYKNGNNEIFFVDNLTDKSFSVSVTSGITEWAVASVCSSGFTTWAKSSDIVSRKAVQDELQIVSYPNPFVERVTLMADNQVLLDGKRFTVFSLYNKVPVATGRLNGIVPTIDLGTLSKGFYYIEVEGMQTPVKISKF